MKRLASITILLLAMTFTFSAAAQSKSVRESINGENITSIKVLGNSRVVWVHDTEKYIQVSWFASDIEQPDSYGITINGNELTFNDSWGRFYYELHLDSSSDIHVVVDGNSRFAYPNGTTHISSKMGNTGISGFVSEIKDLVDELVTTYDSVANSGTATDKTGAAYVNNPRKKCRKYSIADRTNFDFHWAFTNWGDQWYNGLMKMDGPYNLRTSFSSYQLSENYAIVMTEHTKLSIGIGYESDVYKFTDNYVSMDAAGALHTQDQASIDAVSNIAGSNLGDWSTRLVTRYVTMPVEFEYRDKGTLRKFRFAVGVIPGLSFSSSHTGLKHELEQRGRNYQDSQDGVGRFINPYKLDVRLTFKRNGLGVFLQVPTLPVFIDTATKVYPIKIGFML